MDQLVNMSLLFFLNHTAATEIYTLSLHDALPISGRCDHIHPAAGLLHPEATEKERANGRGKAPARFLWLALSFTVASGCRDRKSTRLNSSHLGTSYAVFCLNKKRSRSSRNKEILS